MKQEIQKKLDVLLSRELDPAFARRARWVVRELALSGRERVLEVGCGRGFYEGLLSSLYPRISITGMDVSDAYLARAKTSVAPSRHITFQRGDALALPFRANSFDRVFATEVLEHLPLDEKGLIEMYRVVKPGGTVVVTVPNKNYPFLWDPLNWMLEKLLSIHMPKDIWWLAGIWADHQRLYTPEELVTKATRAGFVVERVSLLTHHCLPLSHFLLYGIGKNIVELGLFPDMYRFSYYQKPGGFLRGIRALTHLFDKKNNDHGEKEGTSTVNIVATLRKKR